MCCAVVIPDAPFLGDFRIMLHRHGMLPTPQPSPSSEEQNALPVLDRSLPQGPVWQDAAVPEDDRSIGRGEASYPAFDADLPAN
jgi:hypothetical protein